MLGITMQLDISARLTPQVTTIIFHHMKNILLKQKKKENTKIWGTRPKPYVNKNDTQVDYTYS